MIVLHTVNKYGGRGDCVTVDKYGGRGDCVTYCR